MKANVVLEIEKEDLNYELKELISEIASTEIRKMVKETAQRLVEEEVKSIISPIVNSYLEEAVVGREYTSAYDRIPNRRDVDKYIKTVLMNYLDEPCYLYSKSSNKLAERYTPSSQGGEKTTRAEHWIMDKTRKYAETELFAVLDEMLKEVASKIIPSEERIQEIIKAELKNLVG